MYDVWVTSAWLLAMGWTIGMFTTAMFPSEKFGPNTGFIAGVSLYVTIVLTLNVYGAWPT